MNLVDGLLTVIVSLGMMTPVHAAGNAYDPGSFSAVAGQQAVFHAAAGRAEIPNAAIEAESASPRERVGTVRHAWGGGAAGSKRLTDVALTSYAGSHAAGLVRGEPPSSGGSRLDPSTTRVSEKHFARAAGIADARQRIGNPGLGAAIPEPDGWMLFLSGVVVVAFMARRKTAGAWHRADS